MTWYEDDVRKMVYFMRAMNRLGLLTESEQDAYIKLFPRGGNYVIKLGSRP